MEQDSYRRVYLVPILAIGIGEAVIYTLVFAAFISDSQGLNYTSPSIWIIPLIAMGYGVVRSPFVRDNLPRDHQAQSVMKWLVRLSIPIFALFFLLLIPLLTGAVNRGLH